MKSLRELLTERTALEKAIQDATKTERKIAVAKVRELVELFAITAKEAGFQNATETVSDQKLKKNKLVSKKSTVTAKNRQPRVKVQAKFMDESGNKWTGRGKCPNWLKQAELNGHPRTKFLI